MIAYDDAYMQITGADAMFQAIKDMKRGITYSLETIDRMGMVRGFMLGSSAGREVLVSDDIEGMGLSSTTLFIGLAKKDTRLPVRILHALHLKMFKKVPDPNQNNQTLMLQVEIPEGHPLKGSLDMVNVHGYLGKNCKAVPFREPLSEERKKQLQDELELGTLRFKTICDGEEVQEPVPDPFAVPPLVLEEVEEEQGPMEVALDQVDPAPYIHND